MRNLEIRSLPNQGLTVREADGTAPAGIVGYAALFEVLSNELTEDLDGAGPVTFHEIITRGAFAQSLKTNDVKCLYNHDDRLILSRTGVGNLILKEDEIGLPFDSAVPRTSYGLDLLENVRVRNQVGCSFGFFIAPGGDEWQLDAGRYIHRINQCDLREISVGVTWPAYTGTSLGLRSMRATHRAATSPPPSAVALPDHKRSLRRLYMETL